MVHAPQATTLAKTREDNLRQFNHSTQQDCKTGKTPTNTEPPITRLLWNIGDVVGPPPAGGQGLHRLPTKKEFANVTGLEEIHMIELELTRVRG